MIAIPTQHKCIARHVILGPSSEGIFLADKKWKMAKLVSFIGVNQ